MSEEYRVLWCNVCGGNTYHEDGFCMDCGKPFWDDDSEENNDRKNLEWLVRECLKNAFISISRGRELLGFQYMEQMRDWLNSEIEERR